MKIDNSSGKQNFTSAYAYINGEWLNLARGGKKVSVQAIKKNVEIHALDGFLKSYCYNRNGELVYDNKITLKNMQRYKPNWYKHNYFKDSRDRKHSDIYVRLHKVGLSGEPQDKETFIILTGKEAAREKDIKTLKGKGQFLRKLLSKGNIPHNNEKLLSHKFLIEPKTDFIPKHGLAWIDASRVDQFIKEAHAAERA